ncbi:MEKHLA domain-containing protein [Candidatus Nitrospira bockiana]
MAEAGDREPWMDAEAVEWVRLLLDSYRRWTGRELVERKESPLAQAAAVFDAPFVLVSHGTGDDPLLNYGNRVALELWETTWEALRRTPSRLTAEPADREERKRMLAQAAERGWFDGYRGVRVSKTGKRFTVENAIVWTVLDDDDRAVGQAATFARWTPIRS